ncbi:T9SS type A sorting domain-containing protein [Emticicia agri]|uniref:T9SS type A sorting domain-containing protein n=1 Tax=Emticicia agri TaxID=2492393 RepID=A0A4Q5M5P1_9BACT|nr:T9SS type A sorting domain-containing protein [Emticicia agri]RYU97692.1 T9SS type A sorting domain-containing protein [Emticicia agri]
MITKTTFKKSIYIGLFVLSLTIKTNGQQTAKPEICKNPPKGYELGGDFTSMPQVACIDYAYSEGLILLGNQAGIDKGSEEYIFNYKDGDSLIFTKQNRYTVNKEGIYWLVQKGTVTESGASKNALICKSIEVIKTDIPDIEYSTCGPLVVNILIKDTPVNRKQSGYSIQYDWDNILSYKPTGLPYSIIFNRTHVFPAIPIVQAIYERNGVKACYSRAVEYVIDNFSIKQLQTLNYGKEVKIQMESREAGKEYFIEYKAKTANDWIESTTIIKANTPSTVAEATITGLDPITQYCFRLAKKDTCNYAFAYSNEMCTELVLSTEYTKGTITISPNPAEDKILINSSGATVRFIELINMKGQLVFKGEISEDTFNLSEFEKGKYFLRLYDANKKLLNTKNIVKW